MTTATLASPQTERYYNSGVSGSAQLLTNLFSFNGVDASKSASSIANIRFLPLDDAYDACSKYDWDGYGANAVTRNTYKNAKDFLRLLPLSHLPTDISVDPDGEISFDWAKDNDMFLSISISDKSLLSFVSVIGDKKRKGCEIFETKIPTDLLGILYQLK